MAIIVEEDKKNSGGGAGALISLVLVILAIAVYYVFFVNPAPATITTPANLQNINALSQIHFDPSAVVDSPSFQALRQYVTEPTSTGPAAVGRGDPFLPL